MVNKVLAYTNRFAYENKVEKNLECNDLFKKGKYKMTINEKRRLSITSGGVEE